MHNALRQQTQKRIDRDFLGYDTRAEMQRRPVGVGLINGSIDADNITTQAPNGDFSRGVHENLGMGVQQRPVLLVVKKNASILKNLNAWVSEVVERRGDTHTAPLLVIDDEADQASVDTGDQNQVSDEGIDPDYDPKTINGEIRKLLSAFPRSAYVAYTATPFADLVSRHPTCRRLRRGPFSAGAHCLIAGPVELRRPGNPVRESIPRIRHRRPSPCRCAVTSTRAARRGSPLGAPQGGRPALRRRRGEDIRPRSRTQSCLSFSSARPAGHVARSPFTTPCSSMSRDFATCISGYTPRSITGSPMLSASCATAPAAARSSIGCRPSGNMTSCRPRMRCVQRSTAAVRRSPDGPRSNPAP